MHRPIQITSPASDPISLTEAKAHLRVTSSSEDTLIGNLVSSATSALDGHTGILGRCMVTQTWVQKFDDWSDIMRLPFPDLSTVVLTYLDASSVEQTVSSALYTTLEDARGAYVRFEDAFTSPSIGPDYAGITATITSGYGDESAVPWALKSAILLHVGSLYETREMSDRDYKPTTAYEALVAPYRRII